MITEVEYNNEKIHLKKGFTGWKVVYPIKNEDGSINWKHLITGGSWFNLLFVIIIVVLILLCVSEYSKAVTMANECLNQSKILIPNMNIQ